MITLLIGDNSFEIERALAELVDSFDGLAEKIDGSQIQLSQLPDLLMGVSLFSSARLVVIRDLGQNKAIWSDFGGWTGKISDDIHLVLVEQKLDKRTTTFKVLKEVAKVREFPIFSDKDFMAVEKWVATEAEGMGINLDKKSAQFLVARVGVDQWQLFNALKKLSLVDDISIDIIKNVIEPNTVENVFNLLETALIGDRVELSQIMSRLKKTEDGYRLFALLSSQAFQLLVASAADKADNLQRDFAIHPFVVSKLSLLAKKVGNKNVPKIIDIFVRADDDMKISKADPWLIIEKALMYVSLVIK
jgi:DNA polymerase III delta subunit